MTAESLTRKTLPAETAGGGFRARRPEAEARQFLQNPALITSTLNCLSDSSNSGLEEVLLERRELWPNAPPQGAPVKQGELPRL
jgi:hypothetical protein